MDLTTIDAHVDQNLERAAELADALRAAPPASAEETLQQWNRISIALGNASGASSLLSEVHPDAEVRDAFDRRQQEASELATHLGLDRELFAVFNDLDPTGLDEQQRRLLDKTLIDFRRAGVDKDEQTRERLREIAAQQVRVGQDFSRNIRVGAGSIKVTPDQLAGMPQDWLDAHPPGADGMVTLTTDYPDLVPVRMYCRDAAVRLDLVKAAANVGWPANDPLLRELFDLRAEQARLLGYESWADYDARVKMIGSGHAIIEFIDRVSGLAREQAMADKHMLLDRKRQDDPQASDVTAADVAYYTELVRQEQHSVSSAVIRQYFDFSAVRQGLLDVTSRLFGVTWQQVDDPAWHEDVTGYDVLLDGQRIGRIYLDLHPREGKYKHAAQFDLMPGVTGEQLPQGALVCNFPRGLIQHSDVETLFHEFGHLVHHVLGGDQRWVRFSGVATEWDFVEAPSQLLEEWAWDAAVLGTFAKNAAGESIPPELVHQMKAAKDIGKGAHTCTQLFYAALSYTTHVRDFAGSDETTLTQLVRRLQEQYSVFPFLDGTHFHCGFGHLDSYSSGYYTYMWSNVIAKDLFSAFDADDLLAEAVAHRYRDCILRPGGSKDAADLVEDFLGREYTFDAFAAWLAG